MNSIDDLEKLSRPELLELWRQLPGAEPPPIRVDRLVRELGYRLQEQQHGRLDKNTLVSLRRHITEFSKSLLAGKAREPVKTPSKVVLEAGSLLARDWEGKRITVQILGPCEFSWDGQKFKSLSAVARKITGQHLSGPLFFGLKGGADG